MPAVSALFLVRGIVSSRSPLGREHDGLAFVLARPPPPALPSEDGGHKNQNMKSLGGGGTHPPRAFR
jgi:hypothetical protein